MRTFLVPGKRVRSFLICWIVGVFAGILVAAGTDDSAVSLMRQAVVCRVSIVALFLTAVLPFLITAFAVLIHSDLLFFASCALRSFGFAYCLWLTVRAFGAAAWLVQPMLQFSDSVLVALYSFLGIWLCCGNGSCVKKWLSACIVTIALVTVFDYLAVSPFLVGLLES